MKIIKLLLIFLLSLTSFGIYSQTIWTNPITGSDPGLVATYTTGQTITSNISVSGIKKGSGISGNVGDNRYNANGWNSVSLDVNDYFEFMITPSSGYKIDFTSFSYNSQVSGSGPTSFSVRTSLDGYTADIGSPLSGSTATLSTISLSGAYQGISSSITFRVYGWGASASGGTFSINDFTFSGSVYANNTVPSIIKTGVIINEFSQGESGSRDYIETLVIGNPCTNLDIRGWIIDDNNGVFSGGPSSGVGIATGYLRFSNNALWSSIPVGTIILIYNGADTSRSITTFFDNNYTDYRLIFPILSTDSTYFIGNNTSPITTNSSYSSTRTLPNWNTQISLKADADGVQIRMPDLSFFHGAAYGTLENTHPDMSNYTPNHLLFGAISPSNGDNRNYYISDTLYSYDFKDKRNWTTDTGSVTRTPGSPNNTKNAAWISYLKACPLPIEISEFTSSCQDGITTIKFTTLSQLNVDYFYLQKSFNGRDWSDFNWFKGEVYSNQPKYYEFTDNNSNTCYYRIKEVDLDNSITYSNIIYSNCISNLKGILIRNLDNNILSVSSEKEINLDIYSIDGKLVKSKFNFENIQLSLDDLPKGMYILKFFNDDLSVNKTEKFIVK